MLAPWWAYAYRSIALIGKIILALVLLGKLLYRQMQQLISAEGALHIARHELEIISQTDSLTQLSNRRRFDAELQKEWDRASRNNSPIAMIILDIDWFKQYNDHYGHLQGDNCLRLVAGIIGTSINRAGDLAARYAGEEFVILLPDTDWSGALNIAEKIRISIEKAFIEHLGSPLAYVTISAGGVSLMRPEKGRSAVALAEADRLLYCAKSNGRDCVEVGKYPLAELDPSIISRKIQL